jgi:hypothetical protein
MNSSLLMSQIGKQIFLPEYYDFPIKLEDAPPFSLYDSPSYKCRIRLPDESIKDTVISTQELATTLELRLDEGRLEKPEDSEAENLKNAIIQSLYKQGYKIQDGIIHLPDNPSKDDFRTLNKLALQKKLEDSKPNIWRYEDRLIPYIANGNDVVPSAIRPKLVVVKPGSQDELLFRYACLHWSIPVSAGYGRRLRFLVFDDNNGKLIGLFGLGDPVYSMQARDLWIGWDKENKAQHLYHIMDAYVLGAVPPYSMLLCGKLIAMLVCSNEVREEFYNKYNGQKSLIRQQTRLPYLALVTTTSAFGKSSIYNRIRIDDNQYWISLGFTQGTGDFHFSNGIYADIRAFAEKHCVPSDKHTAWGDGFRNKREIIRKCLLRLGLSSKLRNHGIRREIFAAPLGSDAIKFLKGEVSNPCFHDWSTYDLSEAFRERWLINRAKRMPVYREYNREQFRLWPSRTNSPKGGS